MTPSQNQSPAGKRRYILPRWSLVLLVILVIFAAAIIWIASGQGPLGTIISVMFASLGLILSLIQVVPARKPVHTSPSPPASIAQPGQPSSPQRANSTIEPPIDEHQHTNLVLNHREDWGEAPHGGQLYGREKESAELTRWIRDDHCRVVAIVGMGGIGKTSLAVSLARQVKDDYSCVFWRSLQNVSTLTDILRDCIQFVAGQQETHLPDDCEPLIALLIRYLQERRCLIILDNVESIMQMGDRAGHVREGFEMYGRLLQRIGETDHQSCLLLTSREKPNDIVRFEGNTSFVRSLALSGMDEAAGKQLLADQGLHGTDEEWATFIRLYSGNPLALKLAAVAIRELFSGSLVAFLQQGETVFGDIYRLLDQQFLRLSREEQEIMYWLAIEREAVTLDDLRNDLLRPVSKGTLIEALYSLRQRSLLDTHGQHSFRLQPVIMEFVTSRFIAEIMKEIDDGHLILFDRHALMKAQAKEYIRASQARFILARIAEQLVASSGKAGSEHTLYSLLSPLRAAGETRPGYAAGNVLNLLIQLQSDLSGANFSSLAVWQAHLRGVSLPGVNFAHADLAKSVFTETFGNILAVTCSPKGDILAAGTTTGEIQVWRVPDGTPLLTLQGHRDWIRSVVFSPDGTLLASGGDDGSIRLWDAQTGQRLKTLQGHQGRVYAVAFGSAGTLLASAGDDQAVYIWDSATGQQLKKLPGHSARIRALAFSPDQVTLASGSEDHTIRLWELTTGQCLKIVQGHTDCIYTLAFNDDGSILASGSSDQTVRLWDTGSQNQGQCLRTLQGHQGRISSVTFNHADNCLASGGDDQAVRLWDVRTGECTRIVQGHSNRVRAVTFCGQDGVLASGGNDQSIRLWDTSSGQCLRVLQGHSSWIYSVAFSSDDSLLAHDCEDHSLRLWSLETGKCLKILRGHSSWVYAIAFSPDGKLLASGSDDQTVRLWETHTGECRSILSGHGGRVRSVAFYPDGTLLASGSDDQQVRLWDVKTGECWKVLPGQSDRIRSVAFSPDGATLASGDEDQCIYLWNIRTGQLAETLPGHVGRVWAVAFNPAGTLLASGGDDQQVYLWRKNNGQWQLLKTLPGHSGRIYSLAFTPDGETLASGSEDASVRLWDAKTGSLRTTLYGHNGRVRAVAFSHTGDKLASGSHDGTVKLWDIPTGDCTQTFRSDRPYEQMNITGISGVTPAQKAMLKTLGAVETETTNV